MLPTSVGNNSWFYSDHAAIVRYDILGHIRVRVTRVSTPCGHLVENENPVMDFKVKRNP